MSYTIGIDIGTLNTTIVGEDGEIFRNSLGGLTTRFFERFVLIYG